MKTAAPELIAAINSGQEFLVADLYTFTLRDGTVLRYTSADIDLTVDGQVFSAQGPLIERSRLTLKAGIEVDTLDLTIYADQSHKIGTQGYHQAVRQGAFDGAGFLLQRLYMPVWGSTTWGAVWLFSGEVAETPRGGRTAIELTIKSPLNRLNIKMPRNVYQAGCLLVHYGPDCGLEEEDWAQSVTVLTGSARNRIVCDLTNQPAGYYDLGTVSFLTGPLAGLTRTIKSYTPGVLEISLPLPSAPAYGVSLKVAPGCDRAAATCQGKFNNLANFRGFPFVPVPETAR